MGHPVQLKEWSWADRGAALSFAQLNLGSEEAAVAAAICCRLIISCHGWFDGREAPPVVATDPQLETDPQ